MMTEEERALVEPVLRKIPRESWRRYLRSVSGGDLNARLKAVKRTLEQVDYKRPGMQRKPASEVIELLGYNLLRDRENGPWLREQILRTMPVSRWRKLFEEYREIDKRRTRLIHGAAGQQGAGSRYMAQYWGQGTYWARAFCEAALLPDCLWQRREQRLPRDEEIIPVSNLPPLHDFQKEVYASIRTLLREGRGTAAIMSLPTGAGKTRVAVQAICDHLAQGVNTATRSHTVLWVAQSDELLRQAWDSFRQMWLAPGGQVESAQISGQRDALKLVRAWGGRKIKELELGEGPTIVIASIQQLHRWARSAGSLQEALPASRMAVVVVDEAHRVLNEQHSLVLRTLGLRDERRWRTLRMSPPVIGLTATPWRRNSAEAASLRNYFQTNLYTPEKLGTKPIIALQKRGILSQITARKLPVGNAPKMTKRELARYDTYHDLPAEYLERLGLEPERNAAILAGIAKIPSKSRSLIFACSVSHAELLTISLNRMFDAGSAALITGTTPRSERVQTIENFRKGHLRFLCNVGVLTAGFDAPRTDVVFITRPTSSAVLYEQMVGRGLRGPLNGGTAQCLVIDVQDDGLPKEILSYSRVMADWNAI